VEKSWAISLPRKKTVAHESVDDNKSAEGVG